MLNKAKEEVTRKSRMEAQRRKREREERELLGDMPMDTGTSGNNSIDKTSHLEYSTINLCLPPWQVVLELQLAEHNLAIHRLLIMFFRSTSASIGEKKMILLVTVTVLLLLPLTSTLNASYEGRKIIVQTDADTIIVHTKLKPVRKLLNDLIMEINIIRGTIIKESSNRVRASNEDEKFHKLVIVTLNSITEMAIQEMKALDTLFPEGKIRQKRALEI